MVIFLPQSWTMTCQCADINKFCGKQISNTNVWSWYKKKATSIITIGEPLSDIAIRESWCILNTVKAKLLLELKNTYSCMSCGSMNTDNPKPSLCLKSHASFHNSQSQKHSHSHEKCVQHQQSYQVCLSLYSNLLFWSVCFIKSFTLQLVCELITMTLSS